MSHDNQVPETSTGNEVPSNVSGLPDIFTSPAGFPRPLMALRTSSDICVTFFNVDPVDYICRICHGGESFEDLLTPCKCKGTIALAHLQCLERWLSESNRNDCELCQYHYRIIREPKYSVPWSILVFLRHPGEHWKDLLIDFVTFIVYTPSTITSTYMLLLLCETIAKSNAKTRGTLVSHAMAFTAIFGIAAINFTYTSWLALCVEKYVDIWRDWYKKHCTLRVVLSQTQLMTKETWGLPKLK